MTQKLAGMTFLHCCTMTLSFCFDIDQILLDGKNEFNYNLNQLNFKAQ
jgi:hypothetical protein